MPEILPIEDHPGNAPDCRLVQTQKTLYRGKPGWLSAYETDSGFIAVLPGMKALAGFYPTADAALKAGRKVL